MAKKNVSQVVSGLGLGMSILEGLVAAIREEGGTDEDIHRLATLEGRVILAGMAKLAVRKDDSYAARFAAAVKACAFGWVNDYVSPKNFPESIFGEVGEGHLLAQPPKAAKGHWTEAEIDAWLAGPEVAGKGLAPATLADGLKYVAGHPQAHLDSPVVFWASVSSGGDVAYLDRHDGERLLHAGGRDDGWDGAYRFLLRKVRKP